MKKFTKIALVVAFIFAIIGMVCLIGSVALGLTWGSFSDMVRNGKFSFGIGDVGNIGIESSNSYVEVEEECDNLDIEIGAGSLKIYYDDVDCIQIEQENISNFEYDVEEDTLNIEGKPKWGIGDTQREVVIVIPNEKKFRNVDLEVGAGEAKVDGLIADSVNIEVGAGQADITGLSVEELKAETGAGELNVEVLGKEEDYSYTLECGIGQIKIGDSSYSGLGNEQNITNPGATGTLDIECGIGEVNIEFKN